MMLILVDHITRQNKWRKGVIGKLIKVKCRKFSGAILRIFAKDCKTSLTERDKKKIGTVRVKFVWSGNKRQAKPTTWCC